MTNWITVLSWKVLWAFGLVALIGLTLHWWGGDQLWPGRYTGYLLPWFLVILIPGVAWSLLMRQWSLAVLLFIPLAMVLHACAPALLPRTHVVQASSGELKVMSFNVWSKNSGPGRIAEAVADHQPDILLLQEITPPQFAIFSRALDEICAASGEVWSKAYEKVTLQAVVSRYPLRSEWADRNKAKVQVVSAETPWGTVMVFNVHPAWGNWQRRNRQLTALLREDILPCVRPVILGGDFNTTEHSEIFGVLASHLHNAHADAGAGFGFTFPASLPPGNVLTPFFPLVRIDHIFFSNHFSALHAATAADAYGSDHRPVTARLAFNSDHAERL